jgi:hypothetical protein
MEASQNLTDSNLSFIIVVSSTLASFHTISICNMKNWSIQGYPIHPIAWIGRESVMISNLNLTLSTPSKSSFPDQ